MSKSIEEGIEGIWIEKKPTPHNGGRSSPFSVSSDSSYSSLEEAAMETASINSIQRKRNFQQSLQIEVRKESSYENETNQFQSPPDGSFVLNNKKKKPWRRRNNRSRIRKDNCKVTENGCNNEPKEEKPERLKTTGLLDANFISNKGKHLLAVIIEEGSLAGTRQVFPANYVSDITVPLIITGTRFNLEIKCRYNQDQQQTLADVFVIKANILDYVKASSCDVFRVFDELKNKMTHEEAVQKLCLTWRPFLTFILSHADEFDQETLSLILETILPPADRSVSTANKSYQRRVQDMIGLFSSQKSNFLIQLGQLDLASDVEFLKLTKRLIELVVVTTKSFDLVHRLLRPCYCGDFEGLLDLIEGCCKDYDPLLKSLATKDFRSLPLIPVKEELKGCITSFLKKGAENDPLVQNILKLEAHLTPNRIDGPWKSAEEFLNVHFRLLREECFASIRERIASVRLEGLQNLQVHLDVKVIGFAVSEGTIVIKVTFTSHKFRPNLMYGNLLCIDVDTNFSNPVWATVKASERKTDVIDIIVVGVGSQYSSCDFERVTDNLLSADLLVTALQRLIACQSGVMIESPTYYHAFRSILERLQNLSENNFPFASEILLKSIRPKMSKMNVPTGLEDVSDSESSEQQSWRLALNQVLEILSGSSQINSPLKKSFSFGTKMDESQQVAAENALNYRFSLIQGPPGCGKTFVGKEIVGAMLKDWNLNGPILVITYKNHALDSFLEHCLEFTKSLVRIGGRSSSETIAEFNLSKQCQTEESRSCFPKEAYKKLQDARAQLQGFAAEVENTAEKSLCGVTPSSLFYFLLEEQGSNGRQQLFSFLLKNFTENYYVKLLKQDIPNLSYEDVKRAVNDILNDSPETGEKLFRFALKDWLSESSLKNFLPRRKNPLFKSDPSKKKVQLDDDEDMEEDEWEDVLGERCVGSESKLEFRKIQKGTQIYRDLQMQIDDVERDEREQEVRDFVDVWDLFDEGRYLLLACWIREWRKKVTEDLLEKLKEYSLVNQEVKELEEKRHVAFLKSRKILGATITGCCLRTGMLCEVAPQVVIVEEAAEILESQLIAALPSSVKHVVLIGDHKQLPPQVQHYRLRVKYNLGVSIFERLAKNGYPVYQLQYHRRGPKSLCPLFSRFYEQDIKASKEDPKPPDVLAKLGLMYWWTHEKPAQLSQLGSSFENEFEAAMVVGSVRLLTEVGNIAANRISIITGYLGQMKVIKKLLEKHKVEGVSICTIDRYQGDENDYIFLSLTRSVYEKTDKPPTLGFLASPNRACVALSRAKVGLYIFGCSTLFSTHATWKKTVGYFQEAGKLGRELSFVKNKKVLIFEHPNDFAMFFKKLEMERRDFKIEALNKFIKELPEVPEGVHDVTEQYQKKIEDLMNGSVLDISDLGVGRDAGGKRFSRFKVTKVKRIYRKDQYSIYLHHQKLIEADQPPPLKFKIDSMAGWMGPMLNKKVNEFFLFHGTDSEEIANTIATSGFDERVASLGGMYGAGTYFAENADKSDQYTSRSSVHHMLLARVILGRPCLLTKPVDWRRPPPVDAKHPIKLFDSLIALSQRKGARGAKSERHQEFIIFDRYQCLPEFLIEYQHE